MNIEAIKQAITKLSQGDFIHFREWFKEYTSNTPISELHNSRRMEETLERLQGSLKGKSGLKTLMEERQREAS